MSVLALLACHADLPQLLELSVAAASHHQLQLSSLLQNEVVLQGEEYDELGSVASQLHDVIIGASDDETQSMVYGASGNLSEGETDGQSFTDASERFRPSSSQGSASDFGTRSPNQH